MKREPVLCIIAAFIVAVVLIPVILSYRYQSSECKERGKVYDARAEKLKRDAAEVLKLGTKKEVVLRFFQKNGIPPRSVDLPEGNETITGTIYLKGCAPAGCGADTALLGLSIDVDKDGKVTSTPRVGALYTDCL